MTFCGSQVSECIKLLQTNSKLPIQRARMRVRVSLPIADVEKVKPKILEGADSVEKDEQGADEWEAVSRQAPASHSSTTASFCFQILLIDPSQFRILNDLLQKECKGRGRLETLTFAATAGS